MYLFRLVIYLWCNIFFEMLDKLFNYSFRIKDFCVVIYKNFVNSVLVMFGNL